MDFVQLVALVGRNGQRYRLAHVCRFFVGGYGAVLGRLDGNGVVYCLECCLHFQIAGGHDKGVFAVGGYFYSHLGCAIHHMDFVQLVALVGRNGQRYRLAHVCRCFVGSYGAVLGWLDGNGVVCHLEGGRDFHVAGGHDKDVFAFGGYFYSHLGCAIHYSQLVELITLVGRNGQRYGLAHICRLFVRGYGAVLGRLNGDGVINHPEVGYDCCITCAHDECITLG